MKRSFAAQLGHETVRILEAGCYKNAAGDRVSISEALAQAVDGTVSYGPDDALPSAPLGERTARIEVRNESTLEAALRLLAEGHRPVALNFASAKNPGGGFLGGALAQEESLARSSGLYACINGSPMYEYHRSYGDAMYSDCAIYSPDVPVFRDDEGLLLPEPYLCSFITSPAVNAGVVLQRDPSRRKAIRSAMRRRVHLVLTLAAAYEHEALVLGAWGCGVFRNDGQEIAELFHDALAHHFRGAFSRVIFAVLDWSAEKRFIGPFERTFR